MRKTLMMAAFGFAAVTGAANAATVIFVPNTFGPPAGYTLVNDFNTAAAQAEVTGNNFQFVTGSVAGQYVQVPGNDTPFLSVFGGGTANFSFGVDVRSFAFDYSTVDTYNTLTINYADGGFENVTGDDILTGGQVSGATSGSFIVNGNGRLISGLTLTTSSNSFEVDNLSVSSNLAVVPEPATWAMMILGFGLVGVSLRRRRTAVAA